MKVHLIKTPEYDFQDFIEVYELLNSFTGPINFVYSDFTFDLKEFPYLNIFDHSNSCLVEEPTPKYNPESYKIDRYHSNVLQWRELLELCNYYRKENYISADDFVCLLTERNNEWNWFSFISDQKNCFVQTQGWHNYITANPKYPIAYQIIENILQSLMKIDVINIPNKYVHASAKGCVNDFCQNKEQITLKLRTADICNECIEKIYEESIDSTVINQVLSIFEGIRNELLFRQNLRTQTQPSAITINRKNQIILSDLKNLEIRLNPLFKTLYIFYLKHTKGVRLVDLSDFKEELLSLYSRFSIVDDAEAVKSRINDLIDPFGGSFSGFVK